MLQNRYCLVPAVRHKGKSSASVDGLDAPLLLRREPASYRSLALNLNMPSVVIHAHEVQSPLFRSPDVPAVSNVPYCKAPRVNPLYQQTVQFEHLAHLADNHVLCNAVKPHLCSPSMYARISSTLAALW